MRFVSLVLVLTAVAMADDALKEKTFYDLNNAQSLFAEYEIKFEKKYTDAADREAHYRAFLTNLEKINKLNKDSTSATYGMNKFTDYTEDERKNMFGLKRKE